ncbi:MAG: hypothetical protein PF570_08650 [Candidatus Cloacimonetes bacterium]|jgi:hypothetical protein|nr:hypothetical protein [Candidatus Cloacimonadota bacterium]
MIGRKDDNYGSKAFGCKFTRISLFGCEKSGMKKELKQSENKTIRLIKNPVLYISILALIVSFLSWVEVNKANRFAERMSIKADRPWFTIVDIMIEEIDNDNYRFIGVLNHRSGGPALNVNFSIGINTLWSEMHTDTPAILPNDIITVHSHKITGPRPLQNDVIKWMFTFTDYFGRPYSLEQQFILRDFGIKEIAYKPKEGFIK